MIHKCTKCNKDLFLVFKPLHYEVWTCLDSDCRTTLHYYVQHNPPVKEYVTVNEHTHKLFLQPFINKNPDELN